MIVAICGEAGSGKNSVGRGLARRLGYRFYSAGDIRREMARERGMTLPEFNKLGEKEDFTDKEVDKFQEELGKKEDNFVIIGRTSAYFIPHAFKVFLKASLEERARRVFQDSVNREEEHYSSLEEARKAIVERRRGDERRYRKYYGINPFDEKYYDLVIDDTRIGINEVVDLIMAEVGKRKKINNPTL
jgi:cytidylate kinase